MLIYEQTVQECDATEDDSSNIAGQRKNPSSQNFKTAR